VYNSWKLLAIVYCVGLGRCHGYELYHYAEDYRLGKVMLVVVCWACEADALSVGRLWMGVFFWLRVEKIRWCWPA
jgi:hypothetical protein